MKVLAAICLCSAVSAVGQTVHPRIVSEPAVDGHLTVVEVRTHFVTAVRMPEAVSSVAIGDPSLFQVEDSEFEPKLVFVKSLTAGPAEKQFAALEGVKKSLIPPLRFFPGRCQRSLYGEIGRRQDGHGPKCWRGPSSPGRAR